MNHTTLKNEITTDGIVLLYPPGTTQSTYTGDNATVAEWTIDANEVVIMLGCTPPPSRYFSVTPYLMAKKLGERRLRGVLFGGVTAPSEHVRVQAAIGDSISAGRNVYSRIRARGGKEGTNNTTTSSPWSSETVFLMTASRQAGFAAIDALQKCGVEDEIINLAPIPKSVAANHVKKNGGPTTNNNVGGTFSTFSLYLRNEGPDDRAAYDAYQAESNEYWTIAAISVPTTTSDDDDNNNYSTNIQSSFDDLPLIDASGGAIETERKLKPALDRLARAAVVKLRREVVGANPRRFDESNAPPASDGRACIARNVNCGLGNRDTVYSQVSPFVRLSSARAMAIIVGVNHGAAKFATYSNLVVNEVRRRLGLVVLSDNTLANSRGVVEQLLGEARPELYVAIVSRDCATAAAVLPTPLDAAPCAEVPTTGWPSAPLDETLSIWERAYADVRTHVGPDVRLMVMPQMITAFDAVSVNPRFVSWG